MDFPQSLEAEGYGSLELTEIEGGGLRITAQPIEPGGPTGRCLEITPAGGSWRLHLPGNITTGMSLDLDENNRWRAT